MTRIVVLFLFLFFCTQVHAEDIDITAEEKVEWHQKEQKIVAIGKAIATKGDMSISSSTLSGYYKPKKGQSKGQINRVVADGNVKMHSSQADAFGDNLDYDLTEDRAILVGKPATIKTAKETLTAKDNIIYYPSKQKAVASGNVHVTDQQNNNLHSDKMIAYFTKSNTTKQNMTLDKVDIFGNVKIITKDAEVTAEKGTYLPQSGLIKLFNNVTINQQGNILRGDKAETNINTGISKLLSGNKLGRVKGVFKEKK
ncbi:MAG: hypothetical protein E7019_01840 [Alphaproteobacteria bacterium]|nr:hypothetical protein [Alphaproteobacteria bacterium]